ncbi:hypothetical protein KFK09_004377 [Dendrobium nobile]|uniref:F-box domain-containing protein n=1 Tax=Dendrobium nobile TaxID=94219 RepID=A0A8T3C5K6_DENNO|nr:hypothetical protein KFK09_004377 [Dendrobium nobile]
MGCCGEEEEDGLLHVLLHDPNPSAEAEESDSASAEAVLSPMNSHFSALGTRDVLRSILQLLPSSDLARAACVCRVWREVASEREVQERAFREPWNVRRLIGSPSSASFWRYLASIDSRSPISSYAATPLLALPSSIPCR